MIILKPIEVAKEIAWRAVSAMGKLGLATLIGTGTVMTTVYYYDEIVASAWWRNKAETLRSRAVGTQLVRNNDGLRIQLQSALKLRTSAVREEHPHPTSAGERNAMASMIQEAISAVGREIYLYSPSPREIADRGHSAGLRQYHALADLRQAPKEEAIPPNSVVSMVDVDYYVDLTYVLGDGNALVAYTFQPEKVAGKVPDGQFCIENNEVVYHVNGGGKWSHPVWDYNTDTLWFYAQPRTLMGQVWHSTLKVLFGGMFNKVIVCHVDQFHVSEHRRVVAVVPFASGRRYHFKWTDLGAELRRMSYEFTSTKEGRAGEKWNFVEGMRRTVPRYGARAKQSRAEPGEVYFSFGRAGQIAEVTIPRMVYEQAAERHKLAKTLYLGDTVKFAGDVVDAKAATVLHSMLLAFDGVKPMTVHAPGLLGQDKFVPGQLAPHFTANYKPDDPLVPYGEDEKKYGKEFAPAPLGELRAVFPTECRANDVAAIQGRLAEPQQNANRPVASVYFLYARQFLDELFATKGVSSHKGRPMTIDEVAQTQQGPRQRQRNFLVEAVGEQNFRVAAMQKKEAYGGPNHPRNISTVNTLHTLQLSAFTLAAKKDALKHTEWYMPCHTPVEIARAVCSLAREQADSVSCTSLVGTDLSRMDGHVNEFLRENVERAFYKRWVHPDHAEELEKLLRAESNCKAYTKTGLKYHTGHSRLSGSPLTTDGNTLMNAFLMYSVRRDAGNGSVEAFKQIGLVYGDDGLTNGMVTDEQVRMTAHNIGFTAKIEERATKGKPISFLARVFLDPWSTSASVQSPKRTLLKLHTYVAADEDPTTKGLEKTVSYIVTDGKTPFIGDWCRAYQSAALLDDPTRTIPSFCEVRDERWVNNHPDMESANDSWPQGEATEDDLAGLVARDLGVEIDEIMNHCQVLKNYHGGVSTLPQLFFPPAHTSRLAVLLDGDDIGSGPLMDSNIELPTDVSMRDGNSETSERDGRAGDGAGAGHDRIDGRKSGSRAESGDGAVLPPSRNAGGARRQAGKGDGAGGPPRPVDSRNRDADRSHRGVQRDTDRGAAPLRRPEGEDRRNKMAYPRRNARDNDPVPRKPLLLVRREHGPSGSQLPAGSSRTPGKHSQELEPCRGKPRPNGGDLERRPRRNVARENRGRPDSTGTRPTGPAAMESPQGAQKQLARKGRSGPVGEKKLVVTSSTTDGAATITTELPTIAVGNKKQRKMAKRTAQLQQRALAAIATMVDQSISEPSQDAASLAYTFDDSKVGPPAGWPPGKPWTRPVMSG